MRSLLAALLSPLPAPPNRRIRKCSLGAAVASGRRQLKGTGSTTARCLGAKLECTWGFRARQSRLLGYYTDQGKLLRRGSAHL